MIFYLIRHGQSRNNALPEPQRVHDPSITELGTRQADHVAAKLTQLSISKIVSSPFQRALESALPSSRRCREIQAEVWVEIHEVGGCYSGFHAGNIRGEAGLNPSQIQAQFSDFELPPTMNDDGWWSKPFRENGDQAILRVKEFGQRIRQAQWTESEQVAFFSHADFIELFAQVHHPDRPNSDIFNASISTYRIEAGDIIPINLNDVDHIPEDDRS